MIKYYPKNPRDYTMVMQDWHVEGNFELTGKFLTDAGVAPKEVEARQDVDDGIAPGEEGHVGDGVGAQGSGKDDVTADAANSIKSDAP